MVPVARELSAIFGADRLAVLQHILSITLVEAPLFVDVVNSGHLVANPVQSPFTLDLTFRSKPFPSQSNQTFQTFLLYEVLHFFERSALNQPPPLQIEPSFSIPPQAYVTCTSQL